MSQTLNQDAQKIHRRSNTLWNLHGGKSKFIVDHLYVRNDLSSLLTSEEWIQEKRKKKEKKRKTMSKIFAKKVDYLMLILKTVQIIVQLFMISVFFFFFSYGLNYWKVVCSERLMILGNLSQIYHMDI